MKTILTLILLIHMLVSCTPYPRYRKGGPPPLRAVPIQGMPTTEQGLRLGDAIIDLLGRPYKGRSKYATGMDCSEFVRKVFDAYDGRDLPRTAAEQFALEPKVPRQRLRYGDLVFFRTTSRAVSHVGICVGGSKFVHSSESRGVIITSLNDKYWGNRYVGAVRVMP